jgi:hypothetical protein
MEEVEFRFSFLVLPSGSRVTVSVQQLTNGLMTGPYLELKFGGIIGSPCGRITGSGRLVGSPCGRVTGSGRLVGRPFGRVTGSGRLVGSPCGRVTGSVEQLTYGEMSKPNLELRYAIRAAVKDFLRANGSGYLQYSSTGLPDRLIGCPFGRALITF